jgi:hypothetical protein
MALAAGSIHHELSALDARRREEAQHAPRPVRIRMTVSTQGVGETRLLGRNGLSFGAYLLEEPTFSYGLVLNQGSLPVNAAPIATATVIKWIRTKNGLYTGADMALAVYVPFVDTTDSTQPTAQMRLKFSLTFEATALRATTGLTG